MSPNVSVLTLFFYHALTLFFITDNCVYRFWTVTILSLLPDLTLLQYVSDFFNITYIILLYYYSSIHYP